MARSPIAIIINPISGTGGRIDVARDRVSYAAGFLAASDLDTSAVFMTERPGHARDLALAALARGQRTVVAWGGDGTVNEVGSALAFTGASLAIVPSGSGNGLARELQIPFDAGAALSVALTGREVTIDAGEISGRLFFNVAGIGFDARVAHRFAVEGPHRRGLRKYAWLAMRELMAYTPDQLTISTASSTVATLSLLVAIANGRQYGNGTLIAPHARLDDGRLDVVIVRDRARMRMLLELPVMFAGRVDWLRGVTVETAESVRIQSPHPVLYHLDGEPVAGTLDVAAEVRPAALRIKVPANFRSSDRPTVDIYKRFTP